MSDWKEIQPRFRALAFRRGPTKVAKEIPASRQSVYNWANGARRPSLAAQQRIKQILREKQR